KKNLVSSGIKLSFLTLISRVLGLVREMTKAKFLGTSSLADAFGIAFLIPNLLRRLFAENSISVAFIPTFRGYLENKKSKEETLEFIRSTFTLISFLTATVVCLGIAAAPFIVRIFLKSSEAALIAETALLTRIMFPYLFVISVAACFQGILNGEKIFLPSGFTPILFNLCVIFGTYIFSRTMENPARAMSTGVLIGGCLQAAFQLPFVAKAGWPVKFVGLKKAFTNPGTRQVVALIVPTIIGMASYQINDMVSTALAGRAGEGIVSSLQYSLRLQELILGVFAVSIGTVILPDLSAYAKSKRWEEYNTTLTWAIKIIALITIPITFYSLISGREIIQLVYKTRRFDERSVFLTLRAFTFHIAGLFFIAANRIISPAFYAQGNTKLPTIAGMIGFAVNITLAFALSFKWSGGGIAFALSAASLVNTIALFAFLKKLDSIDVAKAVKQTILYSLKMILLSLIASVPSYFAHKFFVQKFSGMGRLLGNALPLALTAIIFAAAGILLLIITRDQAASQLLHRKKTKTDSSLNR
ncbi:MAG: murein biosynthesis integral membrane protein MurJ, partial [Treponema sp.]|nr:murein biosynthesis integral membrane protein MurJ [Treponema sp.]